jgi:hypothetical protein
VTEELVVDPQLREVLEYFLAQRNARGAENVGKTLRRELLRPGACGDVDVGGPRFLEALTGDDREGRDENEQTFPADHAGGS